MDQIAERYTHDFIIIYVALILGTWLFMAASVVIDLTTGIEKAKAKGEKIDSHNLRRTFAKMADYWRVQCFGLFVDIFASLFICYPIASMMVGLGILLIEGRSVIENLQEKKSAAAELPDIIARIIQAKDVKDASELINILKQQDK